MERMNASAAEQMWQQATASSFWHTDNVFAELPAQHAV
jgi:hypothetical protein